MAGREEAETLFADAERRQRELQADYALLYSKRGYRYCDLLLDRGASGAVRDRAAQTLEWASRDGFLLDVALDKLTLAHAYLGLALAASEQSHPPCTRATALA